MGDVSGGSIVLWEEQIMLQCIKDAADIVRDSGVQLGNDELQRLAVTLFITRSKAA